MNKARFGDDWWMLLNLFLFISNYHTPKYYQRDITLYFFCREVGEFDSSKGNKNDMRKGYKENAPIL